MSRGPHRRLLDAYIAEVWDARNPAAAGAFLAPSYRRHRSATGEVIDRSGQIRLLEAFLSAFPDASITVHDSVEQDDLIAFRSTMSGTHRGPFLDIPPTGRSVTVGLVDLIGVEDGRFSEQWGGPDIFDLVRQLGGRITIGP